MALGELSAITEKLFIPRLVDNVLNSNILLVFLARKATKLDGGTSIAQPVILAVNNSAASFSGADLMATDTNTNFDGAEFNWAQYYVTISINGLDAIKNSGRAAVVNLLKSRIQLAEASLRQTMGNHLQLDGTGSGGKDLLGLAAAVDDGTNVGTYGGLSRTTYTNWKSQYSANGGVARALTLALMDTVFGNCTKDNDRPNLIVTSHLAYNAYMSILQPYYRNTGDASLASSGFSNVLYQGRPVVVDEQVPTSANHKMWFLNTRYLELYVHADTNFKFVPFIQLARQDQAIAKVLWAGQLVCSSPRMQGQLRDLTP